MKKYLLAVFTLATLNLFSQKDSAKENFIALKLNLLNFLPNGIQNIFSSGIGVSAEIGSFKHFSIAETYSYVSSYQLFDSGNSPPDIYKSFITDIKYSLKSKNKDVIPYIGMYARIANNDVYAYDSSGLLGPLYVTEEAKVNAIAGGAIGGIRFLPGKYFIVDIFGGGGYTSYQKINVIYEYGSNKNEIASTHSNGFRDLRMGICIGFRIDK